MTNATYSPAQVTDPTSENHLIRLYPNQDLRLVLSRDVDDIQIFLTSEFLRLTREEVDKKGSRIYHFAQQYDLTEWADISSAYLGEIALLMKSRIASVCVMLEGQKCHNKDMITIVNPIGSQVKVEPHQVIEVVVFDVDGDHSDAWDYEIHAGEGEIEYEYIGNEVVYPSVQYKTYVRAEDLTDMTLVMPRTTKGMPGREYHFYFRCAYDTLRALKDGANGTYDGGKLCFFPKSESRSDSKSQFKHVVNLSLNVRDRNKGKMYDSLFFPKSFHIVTTPQCLKNTSAKQVIYPKRETTSLSETFLTSEHRSSANNASYSYSHQKSWKNSLFVPSIIIKHKQTQSIDAGCKIAYCVKTKKKRKRSGKK